MNTFRYVNAEHQQARSSPVEHSADNRKVVGSSPTGPTKAYQTHTKQRENMSEQELPMYALIVPSYDGKRIIPRQGWVYSHSKEVAPDGDVFSSLVEEYLRDEGERSLPYDPWLFVKGVSEKAIEGGEYEVITSLSTNTPEELWNFYQWVKKSRCVILRIKTDY